MGQNSIPEAKGGVVLWWRVLQSQRWLGWDGNRSRAIGGLAGIRKRWTDHRKGVGGGGRQMNVGSGRPSQGRQSSPGSKLEECHARRRCVFLEAFQRIAWCWAIHERLDQLMITSQSARLSPSAHCSGAEVSRFMFLVDYTKRTEHTGDGQRRQRTPTSHPASNVAAPKPVPGPTPIQQTPSLPWCSSSRCCRQRPSRSCSSCSWSRCTRRSPRSRQNTHSPCHCSRSPQRCKQAGEQKRGRWVGWRCLRPRGVGSGCL